MNTNNFTDEQKTYINILREAMSKHIGTYSNDLVNSIANACAIEAVKFFNEKVSWTDGKIKPEENKWYNVCFVDNTNNPSGLTMQFRNGIFWYFDDSLGEVKSEDYRDSMSPLYRPVVAYHKLLSFDDIPNEWIEKHIKKLI